MHTLESKSGINGGPWFDKEEYEFMDQLALSAGTDKSSSFHNYTKIYSKFFAHLKEKPIKFLEIGIFFGNSVRLWENYFSQAELHFMDVDLDRVQYHSPRANYHCVDQAKKLELENFVNKVGGEFDVILDDGGHTMEQQLVSFDVLFPHVKKGGMYIIEDLHTSYWSPHGGFGDQNNPKSGPGTCSEFLKGLVDDVNFVGAKTSCGDHEKITPKILSELKKYQKEVESIHFYSCVCVVVKQ